MSTVLFSKADTIMPALYILVLLWLILDFEWAQPTIVLVVLKL